MPAKLIDQRDALKQALDVEAKDGEPLWLVMLGHGTFDGRVGKFNLREDDVSADDLAAGENLVKFSDVASGIDPTTVAFKSLTAPDSTAVLEQNYEYDLVSPDKLMGKGALL